MKLSNIVKLRCKRWDMYCSVPYRYIGKKVELRYDTRRLEIYYKSQRIAMHTTSQTKGHYVTEPKHLSSNNQAITKWSPSYFSDLAAQHGAHIQTYINELIEKRPYPEQAYKQAQGILALVKLYSAERVDLACELANKHPSRTYRMIKEILSNNQDQKAEHSTDQAEDHTIPNHANVRGIDYYQ